jgi:hypothetical protein
VALGFRISGEEKRHDAKPLPFIGPGMRPWHAGRAEERRGRGVRFVPVRPPARCGGARKVMTGGARSSAAVER